VTGVRTGSSARCAEIKPENLIRFVPA